MQDRREENQSRIADIARSIEDLSAELNRRLQIEGDYIVSDTLNNLIEAEITLPTTEPLVAARIVPLESVIQDQGTVASVREPVQENLEDSSVNYRVNLPTEVPRQIIKGEVRELFIRPIEHLEDEEILGSNELQVEQPNDRLVLGNEIEASERASQVSDQPPVNQPIEHIGIGSITGNDKEEDFRIGDLVVITNRYLNLRGRRGTIKKILPKFLELELEYSDRRILRKKKNVRLIQRQP